MPHLPSHPFHTAATQAAVSSVDAPNLAPVMLVTVSRVFGVTCQLPWKPRHPPERP